MNDGTTTKIKVPADVSKLEKAGAEYFKNRKNGVNTDKTNTDAEELARKRKAGADAAAARREAKDLEQRLAEAEAKAAELEAAKQELETKVGEYEPKAKAHDKYTATQRESLLSKLPPEKRAKFKNSDLDTLKEIVGVYTGAGQSGDQQNQNKDGNWKTLYEESFKSSEGAKALDEAILKDESGFNKFMAEQPK